MLRRSRLCVGCRYDLLSLFERGFCGPSTPRVSYLRTQYQQHRPRARTLIAAARLSLRESPRHTQRHQDVEGQNLDHSDQPSNNDRSEHNERAVGAEEVLAAEAEGVDLAEQDANHGNNDVVTPNNDGVQQLLDTLRAEGAKPDEVAKEAREICGDRLSPELLRDNELQVYRRLYGEPLLPEKELDNEDPVLLDKGGSEVPYSSARDSRHSPVDPSEVGLDISNPHQLQQRHSGSIDLEEEDQLQEFDQSISDESDDLEDASFERQHPMTTLGKFETSPRTVNLPYETYLRPLGGVMSGFNNKQLKDVCEKTFGGPGLPDSPLTPRSGKARQQVAVQLEASQHFMGEMEANAFMTTIMPPAYAAITSTLTDARKRLGSSWISQLLQKDGGPRVLDAGAGGAGILAWNDVVRAHWHSNTNKDQPSSPPPSKAVVLTGSHPLRHRAASLLDNTTFIPRLPDYVHTRGRNTLNDDRTDLQRKSFDVIISSYSLLPFKEDWEKKQYIQNLWALLSGSGGLLIIIEKGIPRGFEAIASARDLLLERYIATPPGHNTHYSQQQKQAELNGSPWQPETGMIVGPCSNHERCPMYKVPGISIGRKDICSFSQRYIRPGYLQRVLGAKERNHDDVDFSYLSILKGRDLRRSTFADMSHINDPLTAPTASTGIATPTNTEAWLTHLQAGPSSEDTPTPAHLLPRLVFPPLKRRGHAILDVCTPLGTIERWTVPRSFDKQAFRDARKARWGDLWALGAKTRRSRTIRHGTGKDRLEGVLGGKLRGRGRDEELQNAAGRLRERREAERDAEREERKLEDQLDAADAAREEGGDLPAPILPRSRRRVVEPQPAEEEEMDELDWEIEMKLRAWEKNLGDARPIDGQGKPINQRKKRVREAPEEPDVFWQGGKGSESKEARPLRSA